MRKDIFVFAAGAVLTALSVQHASSVLLWNVVTLCCGLGDRPVVQAYPVASVLRIWRSACWQVIQSYYGKHATPIKLATQLGG